MKNSAVFAQQIKDHRILEDEVLVSFDVISLFTSIPIELALQVTKHKLQDDEQLSCRTDVSVTNIVRLLEFVLQNSYFTKQ